MMTMRTIVSRGRRGSYLRQLPGERGESVEQLWQLRQLPGNPYKP